MLSQSNRLQTGSQLTTDNYCIIDTEIISEDVLVGTTCIKVKDDILDPFKVQASLEQRNGVLKVSCKEKLISVDHSFDKITIDELMLHIQSLGYIPILTKSGISRSLLYYTSCIMKLNWYLFIIYFRFKSFFSLFREKNTFKQ